MFDTGNYISGLISILDKPTQIDVKPYGTSFTDLLKSNIFLLLKMHEHVLLYQELVSFYSLQNFHDAVDPCVSFCNIQYFFSYMTKHFVILSTMNFNYVWNKLQYIPCYKVLNLLAAVKTIRNSRKFKVDWFFAGQSFFIGLQLLLRITNLIMSDQVLSRMSATTRFVRTYLQSRKNAALSTNINIQKLSYIGRLV